MQGTKTTVCALLWAVTMLGTSELAWASALVASDVAAGSSHTCALTPGGGVVCWGANYAGQLGDNTFAGSLSPVTVLGLSSDVVALGSGGEFACALTTAGGVKCWGANVNGQLGDGEAEGSAGAPVDVDGLTAGVVGLGVGQAHACAILANGLVECWGFNGEGQLGDGTTTDSSTPVQVIGLQDVTALALGYDHSCALTTSGGIKCWGMNGFGQFGDGTYVDSATPVNAGPSTEVSSIAAGYFHTCAITTDGAAYCWGLNQNGQLGDGSGAQTENVPTHPTGLGHKSTLIAGGGAHTCILGNGTDHCFGGNASGQLGDGTVVDRSTPVKIEMESSGTAITAGAAHTCAVLGSGRVKCWGQNESGQLGDGTTNNSSLPVTVRN
jgi:alpha-tubulin suppressor-like RCC1 family protein